MEEFELIAKTFQGLEEVLAQELTELGANDIQIGRRMVSFSGNKEMLYRANFCLRTAIRVLKPIKHFKALDAEAVYEAVKSIEWANYLDLNTTFAVDSVVYSQEFRNSKFVAYKVKDAIVDYFREKEGKRPNISVTNPDIKLNMHIAEDQCTLSLDASGESLHLRGYRVASCDAPINEVLAAGLIKLSGWDMESDLIDPFCGSGTIAIEAALMARNIYPGIFRKSFGFEKWKDFDRDLLDRIYNDDSAEREFNHKIYAYDINRPTLEGAMANAKQAGVSDVVEFSQQDFRKFTQPENKAIIVTNPPYGERLQPADILGLYKAIGERLKHEFKGNEAWIISSKQELFDSIGLRPSTKIQLYNGSLDCEFRKYQMFDGKIENFRAAGGEIKTSEDRQRNAERRKGRQFREDFHRRFDDDSREQTEEDREFMQLRNKHREFERVYGRKHRGEDGENDRPRRNFGERKSGKFGDRNNFGDRKSGKFGDRNNFGERKGGKFGDRNNFGDRKGGRFNDHNEQGDRPKGKGGKSFGGRKNFDRHSHGDR